jgi:hypothetical protein
VSCWTDIGDWTLLVDGHMVVGVGVSAGVGGTMRYLSISIVVTVTFTFTVVRLLSCRWDV